MSEHSPNLNLNLYTEADGEEKFASFVEKLTGPGANSNMMLLDAALKEHADKLEKAVMLDENGKVPDAQLPELDFDPAGSAAAVQALLSAHTGNTANPHSVTAAQAGAVPTGRKINGLPLSGDINLTPQNVGAVPTTRTVNGLPLSENINLTPQNVGAVPTSRTVNGLPLSSDIALTPEDIGAYSTSEADSLLAGKAPGYTYGTEDLTAGTSPLETGKLYFMYE